MSTVARTLCLSTGEYTYQLEPSNTYVAEKHETCLEGHIPALGDLAGVKWTRFGQKPEQNTSHHATFRQHPAHSFSLKCFGLWETLIMKSIFITLGGFS